MNRRPVALTIAGTDSGGGAGVAADLKTFEAHGVWGTCAVTAVTAQDTTGVHRVEALSPQMVRAQVEAVAGDIGVDASKTGMLASAELVLAVAAAVRDAAIRNLVVDPVLAASDGTTLLDGVEALRDGLLPLATVVTPNLAEAAALAGLPVEDRAGMEAAARALLERGASVVMVTGGHLAGDSSPDVVVTAGAPALWLEGPRLDARHTHGTGCVLSAAVCAELARGMDPVDACVAARQFVARAIASGVPLGRGTGPVDPGWERAVSGRP
ncbi:MAG TPA: bifunctional hydroxymethylpyrimidine kinase/phosphomethylpyrimidine kinase [Acidimicrobiales bacterium]|nr:bifunctional hydroxymethylpyrimidine kinase/phosphomethylpyrimidine kinase [Acidimicrobiales bacterium]